MTTRRRTARHLLFVAAATTLPFTVTMPAHATDAPQSGSSGLTALPRPEATLGVLPRFGQSGPHVMRAQQALIAAGIQVVGGADGVFGVQTSASIRLFQKSRRLEVTGSIDRATADKLGLALPVQGDRGKAVKRLQKLLMRRRVDVPGGADGIFGTGTAGAIARYQTKVGLASTGVVDPATAIELGFSPKPKRASTSSTTSSTSSSTSTTTTTPSTSTTTTTVPGGNGGGGDGGGRHKLKVGAQGPGVVRLQQSLLAVSIPVPGGADGVFGNATKSALITFQAKAKLAKTGVVNTATRRRLDLELPRIGDHTRAVQRLQERLMASGVTVRGGADGIFGSATSAAVETYQARTGLPATGTVDDRTAVHLDLRPAPDPLPGMPTTTTTSTTSTTSPSSTSAALKVFPVQGKCWYTDTWLAPRGGGRLHEGVDIIAPQGKLVYAVVDGEITRQYFDQAGSLSGNGIRLTSKNGSYYFYAHFSKFANGIQMGSKVKAGQLVGYIGETGNAATPHLHFEVHPGGGDAVNPTPYVRAVDACNVTEPLDQG